MTKEELREHCEKQVKMCEEWAEANDREPSGKIYEEHKLILDLINELQDKSYELWKESYEEEHRRNIRLEEEIKALEQQPSDCISMGVYKQMAWERDVAIEQLKELGYEFGEKIRTSDNCVSRQAVKEGMIKYGFRAPDMTVTEFIEDELPPVTPTHGTCKDCKHFHNVRKDFNTCDLWTIACADNHYCADFEKRGSENE